MRCHQSFSTITLDGPSVVQWLYRFATASWFLSPLRDIKGTKKLFNAKIFKQIWPKAVLQVRSDGNHRAFEVAWGFF